MKAYCIILTLALMGCTHSSGHRVTLEQTRAASQTRQAWRQELRPMLISGNVDVPEIGVRISSADGVDFVPFRFHDKSFSADRALSVDTASTVSACYPASDSDIIDIHAPFSERLYGQECARSVGENIDVKMNFKSAVALLRFSFASDNIKDMLEKLTLKGEAIATTAKYSPYNGQWTEIGGQGQPVGLRVDALLNGCRHRDFYLIPTESDQDITLAAVVNGKEYLYTTKIPPLAAGSMTQINLHLGRELTAKSSWVDNERKIEIASVTTVDTVRVGNYLRKDGLVVAKRDTTCVAVVIESDGKHGKAVAIEDYPTTCNFGGKMLTSGTVFNTIDGYRTEGIINDREASEDEHLVYKPGMPYHDTCAFGYLDGADLTNRLRCGRFGDESMLAAVAKHPCSYVPSLAEMAWLYYLLRYDELLIEPLAGEYLTSSESSFHSFYGIEMTKGIVMPNYSKQYALLKLRLFYLF